MDKYEIVSELGRGSCGSVYLVTGQISKKLLAMKKVQHDENRKTRTKEAVLKEARILSELKHPHIVAYHGSFFDEDERYLYIVQDYCDGGNLDDRIRERVKSQDYFSEKQVMEWFIQIAMAVQYIHSKRILHRDLKPQNIFLTKSDGVKLGDFGIAKALNSTLDAAVTCVGTPCYLSPELCEDIPYSSKSDIWALGCLLYEMCSLRPAFDACNLMGLLRKIITVQYQELPSVYTDDLKNLVHAQLHKIPDDRPSASSILNMEIVKSYLDEFIQKKEYLLQQRIIGAKEKNCSGLSPMKGCLPTVALQPGSNEEAKDDELAYMPDASDHLHRRGHKDAGAASMPLDTGADDAVNYADDFEDQSDDANSDSCNVPEVFEGTADESGNEECYPGLVKLDLNKSQDDLYVDDFEEDSETETLDKIVSNAKSAQGIAVDSEYFEDADMRPLGTDFFRRHNIESLRHKKEERVEFGDELSSKQGNLLPSWHVHKSTDDDNEDDVET